MTGCASGSNTTSTIVMRHGQSEANKTHIIASQPDNARFGYGLTPKGRQQAHAAARAIAFRYPNAPCVVASSPLLRAFQTAAIVDRVMKCDGSVMEEPAFTERSFAAFELQSDTHYKKVWAYDARGEQVGPPFDNKVEELESVKRRTQAALKRLRATYPDHLIVIVTHGDVASNMITIDKNRPLSCHRDVGGLGVAEYYVLHDQTQSRR